MPTRWSRPSRAEAAAARVYDVAELMADPQALARDLVTTVHDPDLGPVRMQNVLARFSATPGAVRFTGRPIGADTDALLAGELGVAEERLAELRSRGVVR